MSARRGETKTGLANNIILSSSTGYLISLTSIKCRLFGRVWIKSIAGPFDGHSVYTSSVQAICSSFHCLLKEQSAKGLMIADARLKSFNTGVSFSIFTQRFAYAGNPYPNIIETPVFAHSENHAMLQICDLFCSGLIFPIAAFSYCTGHVTNVHVDPEYQKLKERYGEKLRKLQYWFQVGDRWTGAIVVSDGLAGRSSKYLFVN